MVQILDTTLREGEQTPGVYFDSHIKLAIAELLDKVGINIIEAGHPIVSEDIYHAVKQLSSKKLNAKIGAHARSVKRDVDLGLECGVGFLGVFYCVSEQRLNGVFNKNIKSAVEQISEVIAYARERDPKLLIRFTPEDTVRSEFSNVIKASVAAVKAGANVISVADTTGFMIPGTKHNMYDYVKRVKEELRAKGVTPSIEVHCHNDRGLALANAIDAYRAGVDIIDASVLGIGERAGIVDLATLLVVLKSDFNEQRWDLLRLKELYKLVSEHSGVPIPVNFPVMGRNAFTHCAGVHTQAALKNPVHYQSLNPEIVGRESKISLDHMSGLASINYMLDKIGERVDEELAQQILVKVKSVGQKGKRVEDDEFKHIVEWCKTHR